MTYSSALFTEPHQSLVDAQYAKYDRLLKQLDVKAGDHILEIGWVGAHLLNMRLIIMAVLSRVFLCLKNN